MAGDFPVERTFFLNISRNKLWSSQHFLNASVKFFHFPSICSGRVKSLDFLSSNSLLHVLAPNVLFSYRTASHVPYIVKLTVKYLLCSTKKPFLLSTLQSTRRLIFVSSGRMTSLFRIIPSIYSAPILGIHSVYSEIGILVTQLNRYSGLFHLFLFRNKVNRMHPKTF